MNKLLLFAAALSISATAMGQTAVSGHDLIKERTGTGSAAKIVKRANSRVADVVTEKGIVAKRIFALPTAAKTVNPRNFTKAPAKADGLDDADILFESFEGWDGVTETWVPEGWTVESKGAAHEEYILSWFPSGGGGWYPPVSDGKYYYGVVYGEDQDEWLISPVVELPDEPKGLFFDINLDPIWFFNLENVDWDAGVFIGEPEVVFNIIVNVREEGGEWAQLINFADRYKGYSLDDLFMISGGEQLLPQSASLADYAGKKIQVAFQYVGSDGQSIFIDNIRIGNPKLDAPVYMMPYSTQYWGFTRNLDALNMGVAALPVYTDLMWMSYDYVDGATYTWQYNDPEDTDKWITVEDDDMLFASYGTDYTSEFTTRNNLYYLPKLTVSAPGASSATYQNPANYMQMGGKPDFIATASDGSQVMLNMGLVPFNRVTEGIGVYTYREDFGTPVLPIFGYSPYVDKFWTDYTFGGQDEEGDGVKLTSILNFVYSSSAPMVVTAADLFAYTQEIGENVEFTCGIYPIDDNFQPMIDTPVAVAKLMGKDITLLSEGDQSPDLSCLTFEFDKAVVLDDTYQAYVVMVSGFNNPDIAYFCPFQSLYPADVPMALGWVCKDITTGGQTRVSYSPMSDPEGEPLYTSFAINLEAWLPWLKCETEELEIGNNGTTVSLDSYYAGEEFAVAAPDWAEVTVEGRYGTTTLTVNAEYSDTAREGEITISAPGVSKTFKLTQPAGTGMSGINEITSGLNGAVDAIYNLNGQKVSSASTAAGVYLIKRASGKVEKVVVK
ncbi:MAG: BACON domain-containing protein [Duncaniella sp.]|nr:BACON domain-containing protein [Duncaniella sp.]